MLDWLLVTTVGNWRFARAAMAFAIVSAGFVGHASGVEPISISVAAALAYDDNQPVLKFEMRNLAKSPLEMYESNLPWGIQISTRLYAFELDAEQTQLEEALYIDDPGPNEIVLKPGAVLHGNIFLEWRFPSLLEVTKTHDVIVFWTYLPRSVNQVRGERFGGWVMVPRSTE